MNSNLLTRREFLKTSAIGVAGLSLIRWSQTAALPDFPKAERLGRVFGGKVSIYARPDVDSQIVGTIYDDEVVVWLRELVGSRPLWFNQRFVETPQGFIYAPNLQPVRNLPNTPLEILPDPQGMWVEVSVPYVDLVLSNPPARSPWVKLSPKPRLYYSQIMWVDQVKRDEQGQIWYRIAEKFGTFGDLFWAAGEAFRPVTAEEMTPINPEVEEKQVEVNLIQQTLSCYEGKTEVYFGRISSGGKYDKDGNPVDEWSTPVGPHQIWRKLVSVHMTGGTTGAGYDLPGIGWTTLFSGNGVAIHSTFWHNSFGVPKSHGCVNANPEDAKWVFRWTFPSVSYDPGDVVISGQASTKVVVIE